MNEEITPAVLGFVNDINLLYTSRASHIFILHGNIEDHCSNDGSRRGVLKHLGMYYDTGVRGDLNTAGADKENKERDKDKDKEVDAVMLVFSMTNGLEFASTWGEKKFLRNFEEVCRALGTEDYELFKTMPRDVDGALDAMNRYFQTSKCVAAMNRELVAKGEVKLPVMQVVLVMTDADAILGFAGELGEKPYSDRKAVVHIRSWARDESIGNANRVVLLCRSLTQIHPSIRGGDSRVSGVLIPRPGLKDREEWLSNYHNLLSKGTYKLNGSMIMGIDLQPDFQLHDFAVQAAGLSRIQMDNIIMGSWMRKIPVGPDAVRIRKKKVLEEEFGGLLDFHEPEYGFKAVGSNTEILAYFRDRVIDPLLKGKKSSCSKGVLLVGPPGVGKSYLVKALAYETRLPCLHITMGRLFGNLVGDTESKTERMLEAVEAAAPCVVIVDEIDSALGQGRITQGDSNTGGRMFNRIMDWLGDENRRGRIVAVGISNRPDLLDDALIRAGRFDAILPSLPPAPGDFDGRASIFATLSQKHKLQFHPELKDTARPGVKDGIGRLLNDTRLWTGAEMEVLLQEANFKAQSRNQTKIGLEDWDTAMKWFGPSTRNVSAYIDLALAATTHLEYCPAGWLDRVEQREERAVSARKSLLSFPAEEFGER